MSPPEGVAVVIPVMHKPSLVRVVSHLGQLPDVAEIVVVDGAVESSGSLTLKAPGEAGLLVASVQSPAEFNKSLFLNIGASLVKSDSLIACDADVLLSPQYVRAAVAELRREERSYVLPEYIRESATGDVRAAPGICAVRKSLFRAIDGYCSEFRGWGLEDRDFLARLALAGGQLMVAHGGVHLTHGDDERTRNYSGRTVTEMRSRNRALFQQRLAAAVLHGTMQADLAALGGIICGSRWIPG